MAALVCDLCGGKLIMGAGGVATCDSCGMEYSPERMKEKVAAFAKAYNQKRKEKDEAASEETENIETITPERKEEGIDNG